MFSPMFSRLDSRGEEEEAPEGADAEDERGGAEEDQGWRGPQGDGEGP